MGRRKGGHQGKHTHVVEKALIHWGHTDNAVVLHAVMRSLRHS